jgi:hypothetical protein
LTTAYYYGITKDYALFCGSGSVFPKTWANPNKICGNALMMNQLVKTNIELLPLT